MHIAHGKWEVVEHPVTNQVDGTCQKCGTKVPAINLELKVLPFGRGDRWQCKGGCD